MLSTQSYKGARDVYPEDMRLRRYIFDTWEQVVESFGYEKYDAPILEPIEIYAAKTGEEIVNDQTYTFVDRGDRKVTIRPEMTPSLARMVAARRQEMPLPARLYSIANFMRYERPQKGREREFWQLNVDIFGVAGIEADIEIIEISDAILKKFSAKPEMYTIKINDRRLVDYIMREYLGLDDAQTMAMIKLLDKRSKISEEDSDEQAKEILSDNVNKLDQIKEVIGVNSAADLAKLLPDDAPFADLKTLMDVVDERGISIKFDPTLMRGFDYYTGIVFEVFDNNPENNRSMFGGGRYDGLVGLFGAEDLPVVGMAPGESTMIEFLQAWNLVPDLKPATDIFIIPIEGAVVGQIADDLRKRGVNVATDTTGRKIDKSIKSAVKMGIPHALFVGDEELKTGKFKLKNLKTEEEKAVSISEITLVFK